MAPDTRPALHSPWDWAALVAVIAFVLLTSAFISQRSEAVQTADDVAPDQHLPIGP